MSEATITLSTENLSNKEYEELSNMCAKYNKNMNKTDKRIKEIIYKIKVSIYKLQCIDDYSGNYDLMNAYDRICNFEKDNFTEQLIN